MLCILLLTTQTCLATNEVSVSCVLHVDSYAKHGRNVTKQVCLAAGKTHVQILFQKVKTWTLYFLQQPELLQARFADLWVVKRTTILLQNELHVFVARFTVPLRLTKLEMFLESSQLES